VSDQVQADAPAEGTVAGSMSLLEHLEEFRKRVLWSAVGVLVAFLSCWWWADALVAWCVQPFMDVVDERLSVMAISEAFLTKIRVAFLVSIFLSSPCTLYQLWAFIRPGLHPHEQRFALPFTFFTSLFFLAGGWFAYDVGMPAMFRYLINDQAQAFELNIRAEWYISNFTKLMLGMGAIFEAPVLAFFFAKVGLLKRWTLVKKGRYIIVGIAILAALITPSPDVPTMLLFSTPMMVLYGISIVIVWVFAKPDP
jgi:sec-independent protein translocase protein TatC